MVSEKKAMRHEIKYLISYADYMALRQRLKAVLWQDENMKGREDYFIRSVYLDDLHNSAYEDKVSGVGERKKYRIRIYDYDYDLIKLESKEKIGSKIHKESVRINQVCCEQIINGSFEGLRERTEPLCKEIYTRAHASGFRSVVVVDYDREAYCYPVSNVRITFDKRLHAGGIHSFDIGDKDLITLPVYPNQSVILEVKYDEVLPEFISRLLAMNYGSTLSVSKYCICKEILHKVNGK